ncbi:MAG: SdiA-regulated domain-containing protein [Candidatus Neomarinimicrobiota bacterium]
MRKISLLIIILFIITIISCKEKEQPPNKPLAYVGAHAISVPEPSGLVMTQDNRGFWTVSDETSTIYRLDNEGIVVQTIKVDGFDFEAITLIDDTTLVILQERTREMVFLDTSGIELKRIKLDLEGELNSGPEGIAFNPKNRHFYILNEKKPSLFVELDEQLNIIKKDTLKFCKDVSGLYFDEANQILWMLSDESQLVIKTDLNGKLLEKIEITIPQPEGITLSEDGRNLYIVSDNKETLYVFKVN